jgi:hypothetical protein
MLHKRLRQGHGIFNNIYGCHIRCANFVTNHQRGPQTVKSINQMTNSWSGWDHVLPMDDPPINGWAPHPDDCDPIPDMGFVGFV